MQLQLAGLSGSEIADALGMAGGGEPLSTWLRDVPPPAWTRRPRAKDNQERLLWPCARCLCVEVRRSGELNLQIDGWCEGLAAHVSAPG